MDELGGPDLSRRQVLAGAAVLAIPGLGRRGVASIRQASSLRGGAAGEWRLARFAPHVGSAFVVRHGGDATTVTLAEASARLPNRADRAGLSGEAFSLIFRGDRSAGIPDGIHTVVHPALGNFTLGLLAVDRVTNGRTYQAVVDQRAPGR